MCRDKFPWIVSTKMRIFIRYYFERQEFLRNIVKKTMWPSTKANREKKSIDSTDAANIPSDFERHYHEKLY